ncbi:hypothetical protein LCGC14_0967490 [marine sediment metagenome]|uniref:Uncharacterized protein n=1 Tax=marine sediment metagenome TaxID=412755 RepID=A0A0F9NCR9_9ZZZZ
METSDDPSVLFAGLFSSGGLLPKLFDGGGGDIGVPAVRAEPPKKTATVVDRGTEEARRNRQRRRAAAGGDLEPPTLGVPGLFGASQGF